MKSGALDIYDRQGEFPEEIEGHRPVSTQKQLCSAQIICEPGYFCVDGIKYACPPGTYGQVYGLNSMKCSGECAAGYYCPSTLRAEDFPDAPQQPWYNVKWPNAPHTESAGYGFECGDVTLYCPQGSPYPKRVDGGYYTVGFDQSVQVNISTVNTTRIAQIICPRGNFCYQGIAYNCPKGTYGDSLGLISPKCTDWCTAGHYCTEGTSDPIPCPPGYFSNDAAYTCSLCPGLQEMDEATIAKIKMPCQNDRSCCFKYLPGDESYEL